MRPPNPIRRADWPALRTGRMALGDYVRKGGQEDHGKVAAQHALAQVCDVAAQFADRARDLVDDADPVARRDG